MGKTLTNVIPNCLNRDYVEHMVRNGADQKWYLVHVEAGKRIYQLYSELDQLVDVGDTSTLAGFINEQFNDPGYGGPWAFATLGGAGGQTIVGALNTGTHGGDFDRPPIADAVMALHLVTDGGKHYWIETVSNEYPQLTDDFMMSIEFGITEYGGIENFEIIRDNNVFNAVLVSAGRFGVIYSVLLRAVPQYALHERRRLHVWQDFKHQIKDRNGPLFTEPAVPSARCRFLQIAICLTPHAFFTKNLAGITKRWEVSLPADPPAGKSVSETFSKHSTSASRGHAWRRRRADHGYSPDPDNPGKAAEPSMLERACADASFLKGVIEAVIEEIEEFVNSNGAVVGAGIGAIAIAGGVGLLLLIPALLLILLILREILDHFDDDTRLGEHMENIKNELLDPNEPDPLKRAAGLFTWQLIAYKAFESQQDDLDFDAISYAMMDRKDYLNISCEVNVDSVEVFFDAVDDRLITFVDALIAYEVMQEFHGKALVGYASLRFMDRSRALIGMQKFEPTCAVEVACLKDVSGSQELIDYAVTLARNPNINGLLHWGQRNDYTMAEVERIYGDNQLNPGGNLGFWRQALGRVTDNGRLDGFSSEFTRRTGLEVVVPQIEAFSFTPSTAHVGDTVTISWECTNNPAGTEVRFQYVQPNGQWTPMLQRPLAGQHQFQADLAGTYAVMFFAALRVNGVERFDKRTAFIRVV